MAAPLILPVAEAAVFTAGCIAIHAQRRRANDVTIFLAALAAVLIVICGIACLPDGSLAQEPAGAEDMRIGNALD